MMTRQNLAYAFVAGAIVLTTHAVLKVYNQSWDIGTISEQLVAIVCVQIAQLIQGEVK